ncbi:MAG TPA: threonine/serine dehydratase [Ilumatobacteraceae bacterium]
MTSLECPDPAPARAEPITPDDVAAAAARIRGHIRVTPVMEMEPGQLGLPYPVVLKLELLQHTGSFKARGAFNRVLVAEAAGEIGPAGLIAASGGNHGAAVAYVGRELGHRAEIFMPSTSPTVKRDRIAGYGAAVNVIDGYFNEAQAASTARQAITGATAIHPFEHPSIIAGAGTMAIELDDQVGAYDTLLVSAGGGGFIAGQAAWLRDRARVIAVEPFASCCLYQARRHGEPVQVDVGGVAADSLGTNRLGSWAWSVIKDFVDDAVLVTDDDIRAAQRALWDELRLVVEPGGAAALAALRVGAYVPEPGERVVVAVCGSNCDPQSVMAPAAS